jgi:hypothetical protein
MSPFSSSTLNSRNPPDFDVSFRAVVIVKKSVTELIGVMNIFLAPLPGRGMALLSWDVGKHAFLTGLRSEFEVCHNSSFLPKLM